MNKPIVLFFVPAAIAFVASYTLVAILGVPPLVAMLGTAIVVPLAITAIAR